jgi:hypothetical protein
LAKTIKNYNNNLNIGNVHVLAMFMEFFLTWAWFIFWLFILVVILACGLMNISTMEAV